MSDLDRFLDKISEIESHNGAYTNHKKMTSGLHKGYSAIGKYGLMPLTIQEIAHSSPDPQVKSLASKDPKEYHSLINSSPELEKKLASELAQKVLDRQGGDELKAAYAWNQGHHLSPEQIPDKKLLESPYVHKYFQLAGPIQKQTTIPTSPEVSMNPIETPQTVPQNKQANMDQILDAYKQIQNPPEEIELRKDIDSSDTDESDENQTSQQDPRMAALEKIKGYAFGGEVASYEPQNEQAVSGVIQPGNIDVMNRPRVQNSDGSISTVRSIGVNVGGQELLLPTVSPSGENWTVPQAVDNYKKTGKHLGIFSSPEASNYYAQKLHEQQADMISKDKK